MNRYESAYRDYTTMQRGPLASSAEADEANSYPQRPERSKRNLGPVAGRVMRQKETMSDSSAESYDPARPYPITGQQNRGFSTDEEYYQQEPGTPHRHHHIPSRELSDRSGGERSNSEFVVANDAIQTYPRQVAICTVSFAALMAHRDLG